MGRREAIRWGRVWAERSRADGIQHEQSEAIDSNEGTELYASQVGNGKKRENENNRPK